MLEKESVHVSFFVSVIKKQGTHLWSQQNLSQHL